MYTEKVLKLPQDLENIEEIHKDLVSNMFSGTESCIEKLVLSDSWIKENSTPVVFTVLSNLRIKKVKTIELGKDLKVELYHEYLKSINRVIIDEFDLLTLKLITGEDTAGIQEEFSISDTLLASMRGQALWNLYLPQFLITTSIASRGFDTKSKKQLLDEFISNNKVKRTAEEIGPNILNAFSIESSLECVMEDLDSDIDIISAMERFNSQITPVKTISENLYQYISNSSGVVFGDLLSMVSYLEIMNVLLQ